MALKLREFITILSGFRKLSMMFLLLVVGVIFRLTGHLTGTEMVDLLRYTAVAFMSANGIEHMTKALQEWVKNKKGE